MKYSIYGQNPKYPLAELVDPVVSGFLIISQEEVVTLLNAKDYRIAELEQAIISNCYDDSSESGKRLIALAIKVQE
jgi:hypothetical protein